MSRLRKMTRSILAVGTLLISTVGAANAQTAIQTTWAALDPGDDWAAQVLRSIFPTTSSGTSLSGIGAESSVIGQIIGQLTGYILAIAAVYLAYATILQIHRAAETGKVLSNSISSWAPVRLMFALTMMFPLPSGFSVGQAAVMQSAMWGIGMARAVYTMTIKAVGPDAVPIATPIIPGTKSIVAGLLENELCRALLNKASGNPNLVPAPTPIQSAANGGLSTFDGNSSYVTWNYSMSNGNDSGSPICGTVSLRQANASATNIAGVSADMSSKQKDILTSVIAQTIRPDAESVAAQMWATRQASSLSQLMSTYTTGTAYYTQQLAAAASQYTAALRASVATADAARGGSLGVVANQNQLNALGWTSAGAYYVEIARLNGQTLSLLSATPTVQPPTFRGLGGGLGRDLAPLISATLTFQQTLKSFTDTTDGQSPASGNAELFSGATPGQNGASTIDQVVRSLNLNEKLLATVVGVMSPTTGSGWIDPFAALINLGQTLVLVSLSALGLAAVLSSTTASAGAMAWNVLTLNFTGAAATASGYMVMQFLGTPIFYGLMAILLPGLMISYILPMIPFAMWIAGVMGWIILVIEAVIAVPLWMFAHLTFQGDGLHGRGVEGYGLLFNVLFRPVLMLIGLLVGYLVFSAASWLLTQGFVIAAGFALSNGWFVTNLLGLVVLLIMFVLMEVTFALVSFRLISLVPYHVIKMIGFQPANRLDIERFSQDVGAVGMAGGLRQIGQGQNRLAQTALEGPPTGNGNPSSGPGAGHGKQTMRAIGVDSTLAAQTDVSPPSQEG